MKNRQEYTEVGSLERKEKQGGYLKSSKYKATCLLPLEIDRCLETCSFRVIQQVKETDIIACIFVASQKSKERESICLSRMVRFSAWLQMRTGLNNRLCKNVDYQGFRTKWLIIVSGLSMKTRVVRWGLLMWTKQQFGFLMFKAEFEAMGKSKRKSKKGKKENSLLCAMHCKVFSLL